MNVVRPKIRLCAVIAVVSSDECRPTKYYYISTKAINLSWDVWITFCIVQFWCSFILNGLFVALAPEILYCSAKTWLKRLTAKDVCCWWTNTLFCLIYCWVNIYYICASDFTFWLKSPSYIYLYMYRWPTIHRRTRQKQMWCGNRSLSMQLMTLSFSSEYHRIFHISRWQSVWLVLLALFDGGTSRAYKKRDI